MLYQQPQGGPLQLDPSYAATFAYNAGTGNESLGAAIALVGTPLRVTGPQGIGFRFDTSAKYINVTPRGPQTLGPFNFVYSFAQLGSVTNGGTILKMVGTSGNNNKIDIYTLADGSVVADVYNSTGSAFTVSTSAGQIVAGGRYTVGLEFDDSTLLWRINGVRSGFAISFSGTRNAESATFTLGGTTTASASANHDIRFAAFAQDRGPALTSNPWQLFLDPVEEDEALMFATVAGTGVMAANGSSAGASTLTAIAQAFAATLGASTGFASTAAAANSLLTSVGSSLSTSSLTAAANAIAQSIGAAAGTAVTGGAARTVFGVVGNTSGGAAASATAVSITQSTGVSLGTGNASASAVSISTSNGTSSGTAALLGNGNVIWQVDGGAAGIATVYGTSNSVAAATTDASGNAVGTSTANATGRTLATSSGAASGSANANGEGQTLAQAVAQAVGSSTASASGVLIAASVGAAAGLSSMAGSTNTVKGAVGTAAGSSTAQSVVVVVFQSVGMSLGASTIDGVAASIRSAIGAANGQAVVSGTTQGGIHYTAYGDKFNITLVFSQYSVKLQPQKYTMELKR